MRHNVFRLKKKEIISGNITEVRVGDIWQVLPFCKELQVMQLFAGDCSEHNVMDTDGRFHRLVDLTVLVKREFLR